MATRGLAARAVLFLACCYPGVAQEDGYVFRSRTSLVLVPVVVHDGAALGPAIAPAAEEQRFVAYLVDDLHL